MNYCRERLLREQQREIKDGRRNSINNESESIMCTIAIDKIDRSI